MIKMLKIMFWIFVGFSFTYVPWSKVSLYLGHIFLNLAGAS